MAHRREVFAFLHAVCMCAERAADHTGKEHDFRKLRACITAQERQHRAFGRRLVGNIGARMTVDQAADYFTARVLAEGALNYNNGKARIADLDGVREDFVRGAILMSNDKFREDFVLRLGVEFPNESTRAVFKRVMTHDYAELVKSENRKVDA